MDLRRSSPAPWLALGLAALGIGLAVNTLLGPLLLGVIDYPFTETVYNETLGLEAISLVLVAPMAIAAGVLVWRRHRAGAALALGPAAYAAYMLVQYVVGPQYLMLQPSVLLHLALFILSASVLVRAAQLTAATHLPIRSSRWGILALLMAGFVMSRWIPALFGTLTNEAIPAAAPDVTMYWSIFFLDLGIVVPAAVATAIALFLGHRWAQSAVYGVVGWFALVPPSVAAMSIVKLVRGDPNAVMADTIQFVVVTVVFAAFAVVLYGKLFGTDARSEQVARAQPSSTAPVASS